MPARRLRWRSARGAAPLAPPAACSSRRSSGGDDEGGSLAALGAHSVRPLWPRVWLTYAGMVVVLENGSLASVDRSSQRLQGYRALGAGCADVYLGANFVGSTPATLELPTGIYKVTCA